MDDEQEDVENILKIIILGNLSVGKTCLLQRFVNNTFNQNYIQTIGIDYRPKIIHSKKSKHRLQFWDMAGNKRYRSIIQNYYSRSFAAILLYDITNIQSFKQIQKWVDQLYLHCQRDFRIVLVGNKSDLQQQRKVSIEQGIRLADKLRISFLQTSAKDAVNVQKAFTLILDGIYKKAKRNHDKYLF